LEAVLIDLHTHVLPRVDDGPDSVQEALRNLAALAAGGTEVVVATPHNMPGLFEADIGRIRFAAEALRDGLVTADVPVELILGQEITFQPEMLEKLARGDLLCINDTAYFLFEFPPYSVPPGARDFIFEARLKGYRPILAHPERNQQLQDDIPLLESFVEGGVLVQVTASSLFGRLGFEAERSSHLMLRKGLVHFIATDTHSFRFGPGDMAEAVSVAAGIIGKETANALVTTNPRAVVEGRPLTP
jgi:protein-tyrosine phosphatase